jgi:hypothetical protein
VIVTLEELREYGALMEKLRADLEPLDEKRPCGEGMEAV